MFDSKSDTLIHKQNISTLILTLIGLLSMRARNHDNSKLYEPEKSMYDEFVPKLREASYGSTEYYDLLEQMGPALKHHYSNNRHHHEYHVCDINGMNLVDIMEMICDWVAANKRMHGKSIYQRLDENAIRFGISDQLMDILRNTVDILIMDN